MPYDTQKRPAVRIATEQSGSDSTLPEVIANDLRRWIALGTFPPGLQLRQIELAGRFGSSRVALREALKQLTAEGIVEHDPNRGFFVASLSTDEARQLYRMRRLLEAELLLTVAWPTKEQLAELRELLKKLEGALQKQDTASWLAYHRRFFASIYDLSPEKVLAREALRLISLTDRYRALAPHALPRSKRKATQERHLLGALAKRDRRRLLATFDADRTRIEHGIQTALRAGLPVPRTVSGARRETRATRR